MSEVLQVVLFAIMLAIVIFVVSALLLMVIYGYTPKELLFNVINYYKFIAGRGKVYCKFCKHSRKFESECICAYYKFIRVEDSPEEPYLITRKCKEVNVNNNCKYYTPNTIGLLFKVLDFIKRKRANNAGKNR